MNIRKTIVCGLFLLVGFTGWAHLPVSVEPRADDGLLDVGWSPLQLGVCTDCPLQLVSGRADVYGVAAGLLNLRQQSAVLSLALENRLEANYFLQAGLASVCEYNFAFEVGLFSLAGRNYGISVGLLNLESNFGERSGYDPCGVIPGLQIGLFNAGGGIQIGLLNYNPQSWIPWFPLLNFPCGRD